MLFHGEGHPGDDSRVSLSVGVGGSIMVRPARFKAGGRLTSSSLERDTPAYAGKGTRKSTPAAPGRGGDPAARRPTGIANVWSGSSRQPASSHSDWHREL